MRSLFPSRVLGCPLHSHYLEDKRIRPSNRPCGNYNQYANRSSALLVQKCELIGSAFRVLLMERRAERNFGREVLKDRVMIFYLALGCLGWQRGRFFSSFNDESGTGHKPPLATALRRLHTLLVLSSSPNDSLWNAWEEKPCLSSKLASTGLIVMVSFPF